MSLGVCNILHVDMDAFFAAVEQHDHPELRGRPVIVGAAPDKRGVVSTASYEARRFGVHSAMPSRTAFKRCPHAVFVRPRMQRYSEISALVMGILRDFTPIVEPVSIDEAFLDVAGVIQASDDPVKLARRLKRRVQDELHLTASVGVAPNKFLAKLASDLEKPDGLTVVPASEDGILEFLAPLPVRALWGVGKATADVLTRRGIQTVGQIQCMSLSDAARTLGAKHGAHIWQLARGRDDRRVVAKKRDEKSVSNEETFPEDCDDDTVIRQTLVELTEKVGRRLRRARKLAGVGQIKVRFGDFRTITRQRSMPEPTSSDRELLALALELYEAEHITEPVRLVGFGVTKLVPSSPDAAGQLRLFPETDRQELARDAELDRAVDALREKYGPRILRRGDWR